MSILRERIEARRAEAVERRANAIAAASAGGEEWYRIGQEILTIHGRIAADVYPAHGVHITRNDPATVIRDQDRVIAGIDADLALLDEYPLVDRGLHTTWQGQHVLTNLNARYPEDDQ